MELLQLTIAAGETKVFEKAGRYFEIIDATSAITVTFVGRDGGTVEDMRSALSGFYAEGSFIGFQVYSATSQTLLIMVTDGRGGSRRQPGVVKVIDGGRERTLAGKAGIGSASQAADAANFSYVQLWNPGTNTLPIAVRRILIDSGAANGFWIRTHNAALAIALGNPVSKLNQGVLGTLELRGGLTAALTGNSVMNAALPANSPFMYSFEEPIVLQPGYGLAVAGGAYSSSIRATFDFYVDAG
jgi:hypothetical protein